MEKDLTNRDLGHKNHKCRICGAEGMFQSYLVREMMSETMDEFEYFLCPECQCMQISEVPDNLGDYYGENYYSMKSSIDLNKPFYTPVNDSAKVLDVGCGIGEWLYEMAAGGHDNLFGCDPFIEKDISYGDRINIRKCDITQMEGDGTFDAIRMCDSFEHVTNPREVLEKANRLLKDDGSIGLSIPIYPNIAFDMYGPHWYQMDAPRHIFIHSVKSIKYLAEQCGLTITKIRYDSDPGQVVFSFFYQHGVFYHRVNDELIGKYFSQADMAKIQALSAEANKNSIGDHAVIWLAKKKD